MSSEPSARKKNTAFKSRRAFGASLSKADFAKLGRHVRRLADELMRCLLSAVTTASTADVAELMSSPVEIRARESVRSAAGGREKRNGIARAFVRSVHRPAVARAETPARARASHAPQSPFDITSPGDLLATVQMMSVQAPAQAEGRAAAAEAPRAPEPERPSTGLLADPPTVPPSTADIEAASERRPRVVLREGERLLSATGSGVVIRRERRVGPRT